MFYHVLFLLRDLWQTYCKSIYQGNLRRISCTEPSTERSCHGDLDLTKILTKGTFRIYPGISYLMFFATLFGFSFQDSVFVFFISLPASIWECWVHVAVFASPFAPYKWPEYPGFSQVQRQICPAIAVFSRPARWRSLSIPTKVCLTPSSLPPHFLTSSLLTPRDLLFPLLLVLASSSASLPSHWAEKNLD